MKNRLEFLNNLGDASCSHEPTAILKEEIDFPREDNKNKSIIIQNLLENENLLLQNKNERIIQYNVDVNNSKRDFPSDEIFMPHNKTFKLSQNIRNNKETNNIKIKNSFQASATADDIEDTLNEVSDTTIHQTVNEKVTINTIAGQSEEKKKRKSIVILGDSIVKRIQGQKLGRKVKQNVIVKPFPGAKLDCMSHYAILTVKCYPDRIIIHCGTNNLKMEESPEAIAKKTIELAKSIKSTTNEVVI